MSQRTYELANLVVFALFVVAIIVLHACVQP
jgi:hypothetical protein